MLSECPLQYTCRIFQSYDIRIYLVHEVVCSPATNTGRFYYSYRPTSSSRLKSFPKRAENIRASHRSDKVNCDVFHAPDRRARPNRQPRPAHVAPKHRPHMLRPAQCRVRTANIGAHACGPAARRVARFRTASSVALALRAALPRCVS